MISCTNLASTTTACFGSVNFHSLNDQWINEVLHNEFKDASENDIATNMLFVNDSIESLNKLAIVCEEWCESSDPIDEMSGKCKNLWNFLKEMNISIQKMQALVYLLCNRSLNQDSLIIDRQIGLASATFYFACVKVPGSTAYSVYHPNLFCLCVDCLAVRDISDKNALDWRNSEIYPLISSSLQSLIPLLKTCHLGGDEDRASTVEHIVISLVHLVTCEVSNSYINFEIDFANMKNRRHDFPSYMVTTLAYQGLSSLIVSHLHGERKKNYSLILLYLRDHILCSEVQESKTIPHKYLVVKQNALNYMCFNLKENLDLYSEVTMAALKDMCLRVRLETEFRNAASHTVCTLLYNLRVDHLVKMIQWLLMLVDTNVRNQRVFGLDVLGHMLTNIQEVDSSFIPADEKVITTKFPIIFSILTRCDDVSTIVRVEAVSLLSQHIKYILDFLKASKGSEDSRKKELCDVHEQDITVNGSHRMFWYNMKSYDQRLNEILSVLHRRVEDSNATARKASVQALESFITFDKAYLNADNLKCLINAADDIDVSTRAQAVLSMTVILDSYPNKSNVLECWIKYVLPLVEDPERTVQEKVLNAMEELFIRKVFINDKKRQNCAFDLFRKLSSGKLSSYDRYLHSAFSIWKSERKLESHDFKQLEEYFVINKHECTWFYLSVLASYKEVSVEICDLAVKEFMVVENSKIWPNNIIHILKVVKLVCSALSSKYLTNIQSILREQIRSMDIPVELISISSEVLCEVESHMGNREEFEVFACDIVKNSSSFLSSVASTSEENESIDVILKHLAIVSEFCVKHKSNITPDLVLVLKSFCFCGKSSTSSGCPKIKPAVQVHALVALGRLCLLDDKVAESVVPAFAKELSTSKEDVVRNSLVIVIADMCKKYPLYDKYIYLITESFKDKAPRIRHQAIFLLSTLLCEGFIKWKNYFFFCFLYTILDVKKDIQELGKHCLQRVLYGKTHTIFEENFVDSIFVFNNFADPKKEKLVEIMQETKTFSLEGKNLTQRRKQIYEYMLGFIDVPSTAILIRNLCEQILKPVAEGDFPLNDTTKGMVRDCFTIISSEKIDVYDEEDIDAREEDNGDEEDNFKEELRAKSEYILTPVIPLVIALKWQVAGSDRHFMKDMIAFLTNILEDFTPHLQDILSADPDLLQHVSVERLNPSRIHR